MAATRDKVLAFVRKRLAEGNPPTVREVQAALGFRAVESAREHLSALVAEGRLVKIEGKARGYRLPGRPHPAALVPLVGRVQAGALTPAVEEIEGYVPVDGRRGIEGLFALRVRGDSMVGAGILAGDVVVVRRQRVASTGDVVVALVGDEATVKRLRLGRGRIELCPENPAHRPIVIEPPDELSLLGRVIEVRRYLDHDGAPGLASR
jgi:repressor LexA